MPQLPSLQTLEVLLDGAYTAELVMGVWAEQHAVYTRFLTRPARKESNLPKLKSSLLAILYTVLLFIEAEEEQSLQKSN